MDIISILDSNGIQHTRDTGHTTANDVSVNCPFCEYDNKFFGNIKLSDPHYFSCWYNAGHATTLKRYLAKVTNMSVVDVTKSLPLSVDKVQTQIVITPVTGFPKGFIAITPSARFNSHRSYLKSRGLTDMHITSLGQQLGMVAGASAHKGHIVFPIVDKGSVVAYQGRAVNGQVPKYKASDTKLGYASLSDVIWNANNCTGGSTLIIAEGIFDVIKLALLGHDCIALLGKSLGSRKKAAIRRIVRMYKRSLYFADSEVTRHDAGKVAASMGAALMYPPKPFNDLGEMTFEDIRKLTL